MREGEIALHSSLGSSVHRIRHDAPSDGIEVECFGPAGLPPHESWNPSRIEPWIKPTPEMWAALSSTPQLRINRPNNVAPSGSAFITWASELVLEQRIR